MSSAVRLQRRARSDDRGASWTLTNTGRTRMQSVRVAPSDAMVVFASGFYDDMGTTQGGVVRSVDGAASFDDGTIRSVAEACADGANPVPETGYKVDLVVATVIETLERLRAAR